MHPIFRFSSDEAENMAIWQQLAPMYWWSSGYRLKPLAEVLAVHPERQGRRRATPAAQDGRLPLVVQQFVGSGRSMFFGFDETWRWRCRDDEAALQQLLDPDDALPVARPADAHRPAPRPADAVPRRRADQGHGPLPRQHAAAGRPDNKGPKADVKVLVEYCPPAKQGAASAPGRVQTLQLAKLEGSWGTFEEHAEPHARRQVPLPPDDART